MTLLEQLNELKRQRAGFIKTARSILDDAEGENRKLSKDEQRKFDEAHKEAGKLNPRITALEEQVAAEREALLNSDSSVGVRADGDDSDQGLWPGLGVIRASQGGGGGGPRRATRGRGHVIGWDAEGHEVRAFGPGELIGRETPEQISSEDRAIGAGIRAVATGDFGGFGETERRALAEGSVPSAGVFTYSGGFIDLARSHARVTEAGARVIPFDTESLTLAKLLSDPTPYWRGENQTITASDPTFGALNFEPKTVAVLVKLSVELSEDARNIGRLVRSTAATAIAQEIDRVALIGTGAANEPLGLINTPGIGSVTGGGTITWEDVARAVLDVRTANGEPSASILHPRDLNNLDLLQSSGGGEWLGPPPSLRVLPLLHTTQIPTTLGGGTDTSAFVGDWSKLLIGMRGATRIEASRQAAASSSSAFADLQVWIRAYARVDIGVALPGHFSEIDTLAAS